MKKFALILFAFGLLPYAGRAQCAEIGVELCGSIFIDVVATMEEAGVQVKMTQFDGSPVPIFGARGGWFLNQYLVFGFAGYGAIRNVNSLDGYNQSYGYLGSFIDLRHKPSSPIHLSTSLFLGFGDSEGFNIEGRSSFWLVEPEVTALFVLTDNIKIGFGTSYRAYLNFPTIADRNISSVSYNFSLLFNGANW